MTTDGAPSVVATNTPEQSFTFRSSYGNTSQVGTNENDLIGKIGSTNDYYPDVTETIIFHNTSTDPRFPAPTAYDAAWIPYLWAFVGGIALLLIAQSRKRGKHADLAS